MDAIAITYSVPVVLIKRFSAEPLSLYVSISLRWRPVGGGRHIGNCQAAASL